MDPKSITEKGDLKVNENGGKKYSGGKPNWALLPLNAVGYVVRVMTFGAAKYGPDNWKQVDKAEYVSALQRHLVAMQEGEFIDPDSKLPHAAHMACNAIFILYQDIVSQKLAKPATSTWDYPKESDE